MEIRRPDVTKMTDEELRRLCLAAVAICMSWIDQTEDPLWSEVADEAYRRGWTKGTPAARQTGLTGRLLGEDK